MLKYLNPHNWHRDVKDWTFRIIEIFISASVLIGFYFACRIFTWERDIEWKVEGKIADAEVLGGFGDFVAGTIGVFLGFASMYLMFRTLKSQRAADLQNAALMRSQQFSSMFFELLSLYHKQVDALSVVEDNQINTWDYEVTDYQVGNYKHQGKDFFTYYMQLLHDEFEPTNGYTNNEKRAIKEYQKIYGKHSAELSVYFRTVYRIFELIEKSDLHERERHSYLKIMRAQFTRGELFFLHYNALTYPGAATRHYITKYRLTKHLFVFDYLEFKPIHALLPDTSEIRINGLNSILYQLWKDIYNIGRGKVDISVVNDELNSLSTKYKFTIRRNQNQEIAIGVKILKDKHNTAPELHSLRGLSPELIGNIIRNLLKCILIHSSFKQLNDSDSISIPRAVINDDENQTEIVVVARGKNNCSIRLSCKDRKLSHSKLR